MQGLDSASTKILRRIPWEILALSAALAVGAWLLVDPGTALFTLLCCCTGFVSY